VARIVLVADDSPTIQKRALGILKGEGFEVETVSNGVAAIKRLSVLRPSVVLADVSMPGRDGYEVCEFVKRSAEHVHVPVLLVASDMEPYDDARGAQVRADGIIKKPFEPQDLIDLVIKFAEKFEADTAPPAEPQPAPPPPAVFVKPILREPTQELPAIGEEHYGLAATSPDGPDLSSVSEGIALVDPSLEDFHAGYAAPAAHAPAPEAIFGETATPHYAEPIDAPEIAFSEDSAEASSPAYFFHQQAAHIETAYAEPAVEATAPEYHAEQPETGAEIPYAEPAAQAALEYGYHHAAAEVGAVYPEPVVEAAPQHSIEPVVTEESAAHYEPAVEPAPEHHFEHLPAEPVEAHAHTDVDSPFFAERTPVSASVDAHSHVIFVPEPPHEHAEEPVLTTEDAPLPSPASASEPPSFAHAAEAPASEPVFIEEEPDHVRSHDHPHPHPHPHREARTMIFRAPVEIAEPVWSDENVRVSPDPTPAPVHAPQPEATFAPPEIPASEPLLEASDSTPSPAATSESFEPETVAAEHAHAASAGTETEHSEPAPVEDAHHIHAAEPEPIAEAHSAEIAETPSHSEVYVAEEAFIEMVKEPASPELPPEPVSEAPVEAAHEPVPEPAPEYHHEPEPEPEPALAAEHGHEAPPVEAAEYPTHQEPQAAPEYESHPAPAEPAPVEVQPATPAPTYDWALIYAVVHRTVARMSPPVMPLEVAEQIARRLAEEIAAELAGESNPPPA
jgi:CheY-like chemotaxis protein